MPALRVEDARELIKVFRPWRREIHRNIEVTHAALRDQREIANRNSASSQVSWRATTIGGLGQGTNTLTTGAVDTSVSQDLVFYGQLANSTETITLENYLVELYHHA